MARYASSAFVTVAVAGMLSAAGALEIVTPSADAMVVADSPYTIEWTGTGDKSRFEIDLYYCGSYCMEGDCGEWVTALCPYGEMGCPDNMGDYDVVMPEPMTGTSGGGYKVRVQEVYDEFSVDCSDAFYLLASEEAPVLGGVEGPYLYVTSPMEGDMAMPGGEYTVEFDYDNGMGSSVDRFKIDLYKAGGSGDCGTWVTSICDKPTIGCRDSTGNYDVEIPADTTAGLYSVRVGKFSDDAVFGCSGIFEVVGDGEVSGSMSYSYTF